MRPSLAAPVRMVNSEVFPTCGKPIIAVFMNLKSLWTAGLQVAQNIGDFRY
jgi:hypothetical protein